MYTAPFDYRRAHDTQEVVAWLQEDPDNTKIIAGGHSLLPLMKLRLASVARLVDISQVAELQGIREDMGGLRIGAFTRHAQLAKDPAVREAAPLLASAAAVIGDMQVRNRGTIGGSLCHADPAADLPAALLALNAELVIAGPGTERRESLDAFFLSPFITTLAADEVLTAIVVPRMAPGAKSTYLKRPHPASGYPVIGVAAWVSVSGGRVEDCRIALTGIGPVPFRAARSEQVLTGRAFTREAIAEAAREARGSGTLEDDEDGYKSQLCQVYVSRALGDIAQGAG